MDGILKIMVNILAGGALIVAGSVLLSRGAEALAQKRTSAAFGYFKAPLGAFFASSALTAAIQSSSAVTVAAVSMANAGLLSLEASMAAVYGANIGTTVTAQLMSLDAAALGPLALAAGIALAAVFRLLKMRGSVPAAVTGLGLLFTGLNILKSGAPLIKESAYIMNFINIYSESGIWCVFFGFVTTALAHSSSATVGLSVAMFAGGVIGFKQAVLITLGDNIGTCVTAQMASVAGGGAGRRVAWGNTLYNILCSLLAFALIDYYIRSVQLITAALGQPDSYLIANAHTLLNVLGACVFLPANKYFCRMLELLIDDGRAEGVPRARRAGGV